MKKFLFVFLVCLLSLSISVGQEDRKAGERTVLTIEDVEYAFRWCPPGTFVMGSPQDEPSRRGDKERQHQVTLTRGFWMLETPVTQGMWMSVMGNNPSHFKGIKLPVDQVSWGTCQEYIKKLNDLKVAPIGFQFSLPTEAQWEYACRAGTTAAYHFGNTLTKEQANFGGNVGQTSEVGKYPANAWGLHDMHGNVSEWCKDFHGNYANYPDGVATDPVGLSLTSHALRGGNWSHDSEHCRSAFRAGGTLPVGGDTCGLRLALVSAE
jgi:formylglycine-generating enzyme required for sulfatase activity